MANNYYTSLTADGIEHLWDGKSFDTLIPTVKTDYEKYVSEYDETGMWGWRKYNWGCDGRIFQSEVKNNHIQLLTAWSTPWFIISKLSHLLNDKELKHVYCDQDNYGSNLFTIIWQNGKMKQAFVQIFNWDTDSYDELIPIDITNQFNVN